MDAGRGASESEVVREGEFRALGHNGIQAAPDGALHGEEVRDVI
jgi:hypothetical protein